VRRKGVDAIIHSFLGKAIARFNLIEDGDRLLVCVSGGFDSMVLLYLLYTRLKFVPVTYTLRVLHIDLGFPDGESGALEKYVQSLEIPFTRVKTDIGPLAHSEANRENPCFLCSRMRRKFIFQNAEALGYNKIVMGHNRDDVLETFFLNMAFSGEMSTMVPKQPFFGGQFLIIRPFYLVDEDVIRRFARRHGIPAFADGCPTGGNSKRALIRDWLESLYPHNRRIKGTLFHALSNVRTDYLPKL